MSQNNDYVVYCHICPNNKKYYGMTKNIKNRWLESNYKHSTKFYEAIQLYGWSNIEHLIVADSLTKEEAELLEEELIRDNMTYDSTYGYNTRVGMKWNDAFMPHTESVICITTNMVFDTIKDAYTYYGIHDSNLSACCKGKRKSCGKYNGQKLVWRYLYRVEL